MIICFLIIPYQKSVWFHRTKIYLEHSSGKG